jgi:hypothetical protein
MKLVFRDARNFAFATLDKWERNCNQLQKAANVIILDALLEETQCLAPATAVAVLEDKVKKLELLLDRKALNAGRDFIDHHVNMGPLSQPDGFA